MALTAEALGALRREQPTVRSQDRYEDDQLERYEPYWLPRPRHWVFGEKEKVCHGHAWAEDDSAAKTAGDSYEKLLQVTHLTSPKQRLTLQQVAESILQDFLEEMASAETATRAREAEMQAAQAALKKLEESPEPCVVQVCGLAGPLCTIHCDSGSTIFHVKKRVEKELGTRVTRQELICAIHKLKNKDLLRWFPTTTENGHPVVQLTLVVLPEEEPSPSLPCWFREPEIQEEPEIEHEQTLALQDVDDARSRLAEAREMEANLHDMPIKKLKVAAECAAANGHLGWFRHKALAAFDRAAGTSLDKECVRAALVSLPQVSPKGEACCDETCRFHPSYVPWRGLYFRPQGWVELGVYSSPSPERRLAQATQDVLIRAAEQEELMQQRSRKARAQELRFQQKAARSQMRSRQEKHAPRRR